MRPRPISTTTLRVLVVAWAVPLAGQQGPCEQITAACKSAGFAQGEAGTGTGLQADCVVPIMQGIAQPAAAKLPLPHIAPKVVAACKVNRPAFGQQKSIELTSFQVGASNLVTTTGTQSAKEGKDSAVVNEIDSAIGHHPANPIYKGPPLTLPAGDSAGTPHSLRLIVWTNDTATVLAGLSGATGSGGAALPTLAQVRAQAQLGKPAGPPGLVVMQVRAGSPAGKALSQMNRCDPPGCAIEIDQLGPDGQIVLKHRFSAGGTVAQSTHNHELEQFGFTFTRISVNDVAGDSATSDLWGVH